MSHSPAPAPPDPLFRAFGAAIHTRRIELNLSQERLAERAHIHRTYIADVERGTRNIALRNVARLAAALDLTLVDLFTRVERLAPPHEAP